MNDVNNNVVPEQDVVPDFILGDALVKAITDGKEVSGESKYYTLDQKPKGTFVYGIGSGSHVKDVIPLYQDKDKKEEEVWFKESIEAYKRSNRMMNLFFICTVIMLLLMFFGTIALISFLM